MWRIWIWSLRMAEGWLQNPAARVGRRPGHRRLTVMELRSATRPGCRFICLRSWLAPSSPHGDVVHQFYIFDWRWLFPYYLHGEIASRKQHLRKLSFFAEEIESLYIVFSPPVLKRLLLEINPFGLVKRKRCYSVYFETRCRKTNLN